MRKGKRNKRGNKEVERRERERESKRIIVGFWLFLFRSMFYDIATVMYSQIMYCDLATRI